MNFSEIPFSNKTRFTESLIRKNALDKRGFEEWVFCPGMLFEELDKWWDEKGERNKPHEGLDLCLYRNQQDRIIRLDEETMIPVMYDGVVVRILNDYLGKSVIVEHGLPDSNNRKFCTIYGHTNPHAGLHLGRKVRKGDIIATLAKLSKSKVGIFSHLHISVGWTSKLISYDQLDWATIVSPNILTLLDPLHFIDWHYSYCCINPNVAKVEDAADPMRQTRRLQNSSSNRIKESS